MSGDGTGVGRRAGKRFVILWVERAGEGYDARGWFVYGDGYAFDSLWGLRGWKASSRVESFGI